MATLTVPLVLSSPRDDAMQLHRAFKGLGCDVPAVINILAHRDATQRGLIQQEYRTAYSEDLLKRLVKELTGNVEIAVVLWTHDPAERDAVIVRRSLTSCRLHDATEVICSRTPTQIQAFKQLYVSKFNDYLEQDIEIYTIGNHKKLLLACLKTPRYEGPEVDRAAAEHDAKALFNAGQRRLGTDEDTFIRTFGERSWAHLAFVATAYHNVYGNSLEKAIKKETSGYFEQGLLTILRCSENPAKYFAKVLRKSMKGLGTNDSALIRVIVTRAEIDMQYIKAEYVKKYKQTLNDAVHSETSGNYRTFLLSLIGPANY